MGSPVFVDNLMARLKALNAPKVPGLQFEHTLEDQNYISIRLDLIDLIGNKYAAAIPGVPICRSTCTLDRSPGSRAGR